MLGKFQLALPPERDAAGSAERNWMPEGMASTTRTLLDIVKRFDADPVAEVAADRGFIEDGLGDFDLVALKDDIRTLEPLVASVAAGRADSVAGVQRVLELSWSSVGRVACSRCPTGLVRRFGNRRRPG